MLKNTSINCDREENWRIFFDFLLYCLDDAMPLPKSVASVDWRDLYLFATKQSLVGVYFRGIKKLPEGVFSDPALLAEWTVLANKLRQQNAVATRVADKICRYFAKNGFRSFILKGQGNALMYPDPGMRTPGDVDVCVAAKDMEVIDFCRKHLKGEEAVYHHIDVRTVDGVSVEVHYRPSFLQNPVHNRRLQKWFEENADLQCKNVVKVNAEGMECSFAVPTTYFNVIYQLLHMEKHVMQTGFGLRQLVDYYLLLMTADNEIIQNKNLEQDLKRFGMYKFAGAIMWVLQECLHLPDEKLIAKPQPKFGRLVLDDMLEGGNFGFYNTHVPAWKRDTQIGRNIHRLERDASLCCYYPSEALSEPLFRLWHFFWRLKRK